MKHYKDMTNNEIIQNRHRQRIILSFYDSSICYDRVTDVQKKLGLNIKYREKYLKTDTLGYKTGVLSVYWFGVKDNLLDLENYIDEIKKSQMYKSFLDKKEA